MFDFGAMNDKELKELEAKLAAEQVSLAAALDQLQLVDGDDVSGVDLADPDQVLNLVRQRTVDVTAVGRVRQMLANNAEARNKVDRELADRDSRKRTIAVYKDLVDRKKLLLSAAAEIEAHIELCKQLGKYSPLGRSVPAAHEIRHSIDEAEKWLGGV